MTLPPPYEIDCHAVASELREAMTITNTEAVSDAELLHKQLLQLAVSMAREFYPEVPEFRPLEDALGLLSQIDNMTTGLSRRAANSAGGVEVKAYLHKPTGNVFSAKDHAILLPKWQRQFAADMTAAEIAADFAPLYTHPSSPVSAEVTEPFQARVAQAHVALFHDDPTDVAERRDRFYEEATEAAQSFGMTEAEAHALVAYTFSRPVGTPEKEIGAAALTLASLCVEAGYDMMACAEADLAALVTPEKIAKVRAKRATRHGRGPLPGLDGGRENG